MTNKMIEQFLAARRSSVPLLAINTPDNPATMQAIQQSLNGKADETPLVMWDAVLGWQGRNEAGLAEISRILIDVEARSDTGAPDNTVTLSFVEQATMALRFSEKAILFLVNGQLQLTEPDRIQAIANLRDAFKGSKPRMCVFLGPQHKFPIELSSDIVVLDEPLPTEEQLLGIVQRIGKKANIINLKTIETMAVDRLRGLAAFPAEQAVSMSLTVDRSKPNKPTVSIDASLLGERTDRMINDTVGLTTHPTRERFTDLSGVEQAEDFHRGIIGGIEPPRVIVFLDEGEKQLGGATADWVGDNGVNKDMLGVLCQRMEDWKSEGLVYYGPGGGGKTHFARAFAGEAGVRCIQLDLGALKGGHHGDSEKNVRQAFKVIEAVGGGQVLFIMTCNKMVTFPPEVKRRFFTNPPWFFDLLDRPGREKVWPIHVKNFSLEEQWQSLTAADMDEVLNLEWTGAEIRNCCRLAYKQRRTIPAASRFIVPLSVADRSAIEKLRREADGKFLSASNPGYYKYIPLGGGPPQLDATDAGERQFNFEN
jgi:hypothetical protein